MAALLTGGLAALLLLGAKQQRRRRDRRRPTEARAAGAATHSRPRGILGVDTQTVFTASAVAAVAFLALSALAFSRPATKPIAIKTPYTEKVSFGYHAKAPAGPVYPDGVVTTGDPIFLKLVHRVRVKAHYRLTTTAPQRLGGTMEVLLRLTSPTGWNRTIQLAAPKRFTGDYASADVALDVPAVQSLIRKVEKLTGGTPGTAYNLSIIPRVHVTGTLASQPLTSDYAPALSLQLDALQLRAGGGSPASGEKDSGLTPSRPGTVSTASTKPNTLTVRGHAVPVTTARWIALIGFLLAASAALLSGVRLLGGSSDPTSLRQPLPPPDRPDRRHHVRPGPPADRRDEHPGPRAARRAQRAADPPPPARRGRHLPRRRRGHALPLSGPARRCASASGAVGGRRLDLRGRGRLRPVAVERPGGEARRPARLEQRDASAVRR